MKDLTNTEKFKTIARNIAEDIIEFEGTEEELQEYLTENFYYISLDSTGEWVIAWDCEVLFDSNNGLTCEKETHDLYNMLDNAIWEIVETFKSSWLNELTSEQIARIKKVSKREFETLEVTIDSDGHYNISNEHFHDALKLGYFDVISDPTQLLEDIESYLTMFVWIK